MKTKQKILEKHLGSSISYYNGCVHGGIKVVEDAMDEYAKIYHKNKANEVSTSQDKALNLAVVNDTVCLKNQNWRDCVKRSFFKYGCAGCDDSEQTGR